MGEALQVLFPGIEVEAELPNTIAEPPPGKLFRVRDLRAVDGPLDRFARLIESPPADSQDWTADLRSRLRKLREVPLPYVLSPSEARIETEGEICYLEPYWNKPL